MSDQIINDLLSLRQEIKDSLEEIERRITILTIQGTDNLVGYWYDHEDDVYRWKCVVPGCKLSSRSGSLVDIPLKHEKNAKCFVHNVVHNGYTY